jgi:DUF1680 family protein
MDAGFPWDGRVRLIVEQARSAPWRLALRIPYWARTYSISVNGERITNPVIEKGYILLDRTWKENDLVELILDMPAEFISSNPRVDATRGCLAIQRGPIVYCLEDHDQVIHGRLLDVEVDREKPLVSTWRPDLLDGVMAVEASGQFSDDQEWQENLYLMTGTPIHKKKYKTRLLAVPYFAWGNRTLCGMRVWIPEMRD